jgi:TPR repeat protein
MLKAEEFLLLAINKGNLDAILRLAWLYDIKFKDYKKAEQYYLMAIEKNSSVAILPLVLLYFRKRANKERALELINIFNKEMSLEFIKSIDKEIKNYSILYTSTLILLWNNEIEVAINQFNNIFSLEESLEDNSYFVQFCIQMFLAKKQYNYVHKLFSENNYEIKERLKPLYYALMSYMQDSFPDEIKKMGDELKETVDEIIDEINQMEKVYA